MYGMSPVRPVTGIQLLLHCYEETSCVNGEILAPWVFGICEFLSTSNVIYLLKINSISVQSALLAL